MTGMNAQRGKGRAAWLLATVAVGALTAVAAQAQTAPAPQTDAVEEVVVTGSYSRSLQKAVDMKRDTIGFSDSIVATDVANFPDQNLAEALRAPDNLSRQRRLRRDVAVGRLALDAGRHGPALRDRRQDLGAGLGRGRAARPAGA
jgi:hypothetical protein